MFANITLIMNMNGIADKKAIPKAINFRVFPMRLKTANKSHKNRMETDAIALPIENMALVFSRRLNKYKYGMIKMLNDIKLKTIPFFPSRMPGKDMTHAKTMELTGMSDHVNLPDIARLQIMHTIIPVKSVIEKRIERITFFVMLFSSFLFSAIRFSSTFCS